MTQNSPTLQNGPSEHVVLVCPSCQHEWHAATLVPGAWWAVAPAQIAKMCYCVKCHAAPPMRVLDTAESVLDSAADWRR